MGKRSPRPGKRTVAVPATAVTVLQTHLATPHGRQSGSGTAGRTSPSTRAEPSRPAPKPPSVDRVTAPCAHSGISGPGPLPCGRANGDGTPRHDAPNIAREGGHDLLGVRAGGRPWRAAARPRHHRASSPTSCAAYPHRMPPWTLACRTAANRWPAQSVHAVDRPADAAGRGRSLVESL